MTSFKAAVLAMFVALSGCATMAAHDAETLGGQGFEMQQPQSGYSVGDASSNPYDNPPQNNDRDSVNPQHYMISGY